MARFTEKCNLEYTHEPFSWSTQYKLRKDQAIKESTRYTNINFDVDIVKSTDTVT